MAKAFLLAVERSGENLGLEIIGAAREAGLQIQWSGVVGSRLAAAGVQNMADGEVLAVIGLVEVLRHYLALRRLHQQVLDHLRRQRPKLVVLIDHPAFNLPIARAAKAMGLHVLYVVGPQIWAWRAQRIHQIKAVVDQMLVLFPFEVPLYEAAGIPVALLAHPLLAQTAQAPTREEARARLGLPANSPVLALLPGSRRGELERLTRRFGQTVAELRRQMPDVLPVVALAREELLPLWERRWREGAKDIPVQVRVGRTQEVLAAADAVLVASGTATLETALTARPAVVVYALNPLSYRLARRLVKTPFIAMPNILLQRAVYPEFIQQDFRPAAVAQTLAGLLRSGGVEQRQALAPLRALLQGDGRAVLGGILTRMLA
ncbi:lipid-A-disaccharide synthase [Acidithiobacillus sp.]